MAIFNHRCSNLFLFVFLILSFAWFGTAAIAAQSMRGLTVLSIKDNDGRTIQLYKKSYALLIGVSNYTQGWPDLDSIPGELEQVKQALQGNGFISRVVIDPDSQALRKAFQDFINDYGFEADNRLLFYFSGHGYTRQKGQKGYLVPTDSPDPRLDEKNFLRTALDMGQILSWSRQMEARHALFLFDSCFSGTIFKSRALPKIPPHISAVTARPVRQFISAGSAGEEVPAKSVFTPLFIRAINGEADFNKDNYITGTELGMYLHNKVTDYESGQTPQYGKIRDPDLDEGDFVFSPTQTVLLSTENVTPVQPVQPTEKDLHKGAILLQDNFSEFYGRKQSLFPESIMQFSSSRGKGCLQVFGTGIIPVMYTTMKVRDFVVEFEVSVSSPPGSKYGLILRSDDVKGGLAFYYYLEIDPFQQLVVLNTWDRVWKQSTNNVLRAEGLLLDGTNSFQFEVFRSNFTVFINGNKAGTIVNHHLQKAGLIGLCMSGQKVPDTLCFDNLILYEYKPD